MKIKISAICFFITLTTISSCTQNRIQKISIENKSEFIYTDKVISISWKDIKVNNPTLDSNNFKIIEAASKKEIPFQLEYLGYSEIQNLLVQVSLEPNDRLELLFLDENHSDFVTKTYGRYVPERLDDFTWENDRIAYRMYGKALEVGGVGNAYGIDVWVKRTNRNDYQRAI